MRRVFRDLNLLRLIVSNLYETEFWTFTRAFAGKDPKISQNILLLLIERDQIWPTKKDREKLEKCIVCESNLFNKRFELCLSCAEYCCKECSIGGDEWYACDECYWTKFSSFNLRYKFSFDFTNKETRIATAKWISGLIDMDEHRKFMDPELIKKYGI